MNTSAERTSYPKLESKKGFCKAFKSKTKLDEKYIYIYIYIKSSLYTNQYSSVFA